MTQDTDTRTATRGKSGNRLEIERQILDAAESVFAENGFGGASMQSIADRAELPKANLHYYFATKESLYHRVVERIFVIWLAAADSFDEDADPASALARYIESKMDISREHPAGSRVWAAEVMHGAPAIQSFLETTLREWTAGREAVIQRWIDGGQITAVSPKHLLYMIWSTTQHYADFDVQVRLLLDAKAGADGHLDDAARFLEELFLRGLAPGTEPDGSPGAGSGGRTGAGPDGRTGAGPDGKTGG